MAIHPAVERFLHDNAIEHQTMDCDPDLADTAQFCEAYDIPLDRSANAILVASRKPEGLYALCVVLATTKLDVNGTVRKRLGARKVSFASAEDTLARTNQAIGGVTIFGIPDDIPIWIDNRVGEKDWVIVGAGTRTAKIRIDPDELRTHARFEFVEGLGNDVDTRGA
jgi:prolyl-tRNA editing enzyme YbaK/EbsC (Cys-tRNA(Pro) deacylase)